MRRPINASALRSLKPHMTGSAKARVKYIIRGLNTRGVWAVENPDVRPTSSQGLTVCHSCRELYWVTPDRPEKTLENREGTFCVDCHRSLWADDGTVRIRDNARRAKK